MPHVRSLGRKSSGLVDPVPELFNDIYPYAWFSGFALAFALYLIGMQLAGGRFAQSASSRQSP